MRFDSSTGPLLRLFAVFVFAALTACSEGGGDCDPETGDYSGCVCDTTSGGIQDCLHPASAGAPWVCDAAPGESGFLVRGECPSGTECNQGFCSLPLPSECDGCGGAFCSGRCELCEVCTR